MTITVFHMKRQDELTYLASRNTREGVLREQARRPSLDYTVEQLEALRENAVARRVYFRRLANRQALSAMDLFAAGVYVPVARIAVETLDEAFELTSNHNGSWVRKGDPRVTLTAQNLVCNRDGITCTSSDSGDLFRNDETGEYFLCTADDFMSLGKLALQAAA